MNASSLNELQEPLKTKYKAEPKAVQIHAATLPKECSFWYEIKLVIFG
jgi:hypothetical protein